jgi:hypothetical protein
VNKGIYAVCATAFFVSYCFMVSTYGSSYISWALLAGAVSQFVAQDDMKYSWIVANVLAYVALGFAVVGGM